MKTSPIPLAALACTLCCASAVAAPPPEELPSIEVSYADLDLDTRQGTDALYRRIHAAARQVCGPAPLTRLVRMHSMWKACTEQATAQAVAQLDRPMLNALHRSRALRRRPG